MDAAAVLRALSHGVVLQVQYEGRYPSGPNGERMESYQVAVGCDIRGSLEERQAAADDLRKFMIPPTQQQVEAWIAELSVTVAKRPDDAFTEELRITVYGNRLMNYPADIVHSALSDPPHRFFPTWEELKTLCERRASPRRNMLAALERGPLPQARQYRPPNQDERDRIKVLVDEQFPMRAPEIREKAFEAALKGNCMEVKSTE